MGIYIDFETKTGARRIIGIKSDDLNLIAKRILNMKGSDTVVRFVNNKTGETIKGPKFDTTEQELAPEQSQRLKRMLGNVKIKDPIEPSQHEPRDRFQENKNMDEIKKFRNIIRECLSEIRQENDPRERLKESLRSLVKRTLTEMAATTAKPEPDKEETETRSKQYNKK